MLAAWSWGFALGIALAGWLPATPWTLGLALAAVRLVKWPRARPFLVAALIMPAAAWWALACQPVPDAEDVSHRAPRRFVRLVGTIAEVPRADEDRWRTRLAVDAYDGTEPCGGTVVLNLPPGPRPVPGERYMVAGSLREPIGPQNPGEPDHAAYLARQGVFATCFAFEARRLGDADGVAWAFARGLDAVRLRLLDGLGAGLDARDAALFGSLVLGGGAAPVDRPTADAFRDVGLSHLLAASGTQVSLVAALAFGLLRRAGLGTAWAAGLAAFPVLGYLALTGAPPSMVRATGMGLVALLGLALGRQAVPYAAFHATALAMLAWDPGTLFDLGFQFSVLATYGLLRLADRLREHPLPGPAAAWGLVATPVAAYLWVTPWQVHTFGTASWLALPANWLAAPIILALTPWGLGLAALGTLLPGVVAVANQATALALALLRGGVTAFAAVPGQSMQVPDPGLWPLVALYAALVARDRRRRIGFALAACLAWPLQPAPAGMPAAGALQLAFLAVGQGDACVIRTPDGAWILVDAGPAGPGFDAGAATVLPLLRRWGCRALDLVVATHAHADHVGGFPAIARALPIRQAWDAGQAEGPSEVDMLAAWLTAGVPWAIADRRSRWQRGGVTLEVLSRPRAGATTNDGSVVIALRTPGFGAVLTGDLEAAGEAAILADGPIQPVDVLKVGHHGSRTSTSPAWLRALRPRLGVVSVGRRNRFGHPRAEVLDRLRAAGCAVARTDRQGAVLVRVKPDGWAYTSGTASWRHWRALAPRR